MPLKNLSRRLSLYSRSLTVVSLLLLPLSATATPDGGTCTLKQSDAAELKLKKVNNWTDLHIFYKAFKVCDDGGVSELISASVVHNLAHHWSSLPQLATEIKKDPAFGSFVTEHIDSTADSRDLIEVKRTATSLCPPKLTQLCTRIKTAALTALRDS